MELDPSLWLSTVRAVPSIGIHSKPTYESGSELLSLIRPLIQKWTPDASGIELALNPFDVKVDEGSGFITAVSQKTASAGFTYKGAVQDDGTSGPMLRFVSDQRPVTHILADCVAKLLQTYSELQKNRRREIELIGIVVGGTLNLTNPPPGFRDFMDYFGRPWASGASAGKLAFSINLSETDEYIERCHHVLEWNAESESKILAFRLDWQRKFKELRLFNHAHLGENVSAVVDSALAYFGKFGTGDLGYVH